MIKGNIFTTKCQTIVNTVNCVGIMGAGIAYECKIRYPMMYERYVELCKKKLFNIGMLWLYKSEDRWVINFPTKYHWKLESKEEYLEKGLRKFLDTYKEKGITSIAFPILGASNGGISEKISLEIMTRYLDKCDIDVEIYHYDPLAQDDLFIHFKELYSKIPELELAKKTRIRIDRIKKLRMALEDENIRSLSQLVTVNGVGVDTLEKSFQFVMHYKEIESTLDFE